MKKLLTTTELAQTYGVGRESIRKWRSKEGFPFQKMGPKSFRYDLEEVQQYFKNNAKKVGK